MKQTTTAPASDLATLSDLNRDYIQSVQTSDVQRFNEILADDFLCSLPDGSLLDRQRFLEQTARPVTIANLAAHDVNIRSSATSPSFTHARRSPGRMGGPGRGAIRMCGRGVRASGSPSPPTLRGWLDDQGSGIRDQGSVQPKAQEGQ
jgi:hypothetical protein